MRRTALVGIFALTASTSLAQTGTAPGQAPEAPAAEAPAAPAQAAPASDAPAASQQAGTTGPANLCQELVAFMKAPPPEAAAGAAPAKPAAAAPSQAAQQPDRQAKAAEQGTTPPSGEAVPPQSGADTGSAQALSGQSGPAHAAPVQNPAPVAESNVQNAEQKSSLSAPVPKDTSSTPKDSVMSVSEAEELASANDIAACQDAARELRLAGVAMPPPLLALTALDLQYQQTGTPQ
jgi:hypothetical protein